MYTESLAHKLVVNSGVKSALGTSPFTVNCCDTESAHPALLVVINLAVYNPMALYLCVAFNPLKALLAPEAGSPKFQAQLVILPDAIEDVSTKMAEASVRQTSGETNPGFGNGLIMIDLVKGVTVAQPLSVATAKLMV